MLRTLPIRFAEPLSRRGVARAPNPKKVRQSTSYIRNPLLAASEMAKKTFPQGFYEKKSESYDLPDEDEEELRKDTTLVGQGRKAWRWIQKERRKGANSGWVVLFYSACVAYFIWRFLTNYIWSWKNENKHQQAHLKHGMADSHNLLLGIPLHENTGYEVEDQMTVTAESFERPRIVSSPEPSEKLPVPNKFVSMQLREFDDLEQVDFWTRSLHVVDWPDEKKDKNKKKSSAAGSVTGSNVDSAAVRTFDGDRPLPTSAEIYEAPKQERTYRPSLWQRTIGILFENDENEKSKQQQEQIVAAKQGTDLDYVHGMMRCSAITPLNNCVPDVHKVPMEVVRKMLTCLGPLHILRDPLNLYVPVRLYLKREKRQDLLCLGLGNAAVLPTFIHRQYPHYVIDCVEGDGGLIRTLRRNFGFHEKSKLNLFPEDPAEYVRRIAALSQPTGGVKMGNYDAVFVDLVNEQGLIPKEYSRLEFLSNVRDCMSGRGILIMNVPNKDDRILSSVVSNVRMVFDGRSVVLMHCKTTNNTVVMTFNDMMGKGHPKFGDCADPEQFKELMKTWLNHYHEERRMPLDLLHEITPESFQTLLPGKKYAIRNPAHMPR